MLNMLYARPELKHLWRCADLIYASGPTKLVTNIEGVRVVLETHCTTGVIQGCSIGGNMFNLSINEDLRTIQQKFPELAVQGLHDDITILANRREDFGKLIEATQFMEPLLREQDFCMNLSKSRFIYYGESELPVDLKEAINVAGLKLVSRPGIPNRRRGTQTSLYPWRASRSQQRRDRKNGLTRRSRQS